MKVIQILNQLYRQYNFEYAITLGKFADVLKNLKQYEKY